MRDKITKIIITIINLIIKLVIRNMVTDSSNIFNNTVSLWETLIFLSSVTVDWEIFMKFTI